MPHTPKPDGSQPWQATVITLFPEMFPGPLGVSLTGQALETGLWSLQSIPLREFGEGRHRQVDDTPAGGGAGMVLRADIVAAAVDHASSSSAGRADIPRIYLSPRGRPLTQEFARELAAGPGALMLAGRFEGVDERVREARNFQEVSIGDYVLSGGELAAMVLIDACVRLLPGVLGGSESLEHESFENGLLEYPQYTRPRQWEGHPIPDVLLSGDHGRIAKWRHHRSTELTRARRPDLIASKPREK
ncbi:MAG: tRNA (guanosine(37)-N1)-methyltransferase TrmD [Alphaproteobacteria bacterium]|nr:tRNA (guanosine(37)-N1)-methyltransferase TrmD [Alphaproteobacteria bacterium]